VGFNSPNALEFRGLHGSTRNPSMTDSPSTATDAKPAKTKTPYLRRLLLAGAFALTFVAGGLVISGAPAAVAAMAMDHGGMGGHGGMHAMMQVHLDKMLTAIDATPEQRERIKSILKTAMTSLGPVHERMAATHSELHRILTAPTIDRGALEQTRSNLMGDLDQASKTLTQAIGDAAEVLTPAQRTKLGTMMADHHATMMMDHQHPHP
jgi:protein CpxP